MLVLLPYTLAPGRCKCSITLVRLALSSTMHGLSMAMGLQRTVKAGIRFTRGCSRIIPYAVVSCLRSHPESCYLKGARNPLCTLLCSGVCGKRKSLGSTSAGASHHRVSLYIRSETPLENKTAVCPKCSSRYNTSADSSKKRTQQPSQRREREREPHGIVLLSTPCCGPTPDPCLLVHTQQSLLSLAGTAKYQSCGELVDRASTLGQPQQEQQQHQREVEGSGLTRSVGRSCLPRRGESEWPGWRRPGAWTRASMVRGGGGRMRRRRAAARRRASWKG